MVLISTNLNGILNFIFSKQSIMMVNKSNMTFADWLVDLFVKYFLKINS